MIYLKCPIGVVVAHLWIPADGPGFDPRIGHFYKKLTNTLHIDQEQFSILKNK